MTDDYDDLLYLPHPDPQKHPRMPRLDRAAQFSPFAALTGYEGAVKEAARLTHERVELEEDELAVLDERLRRALAWKGEAPVVSVTWFRPDERKAGGAYVTTRGRIRRVDRWERVLLLEDGGKIPVDDIVELEGEIFERID